MQNAATAAGRRRSPFEDVIVEAKRNEYADADRGSARVHIDTTGCMDELTRFGMPVARNENTGERSGSKTARLYGSSRDVAPTEPECRLLRLPSPHSRAQDLH